MITYKQIRTCTNEEAVNLTRERPRLFYSVPSAYEARPLDIYKACALAALEGLSKQAGHSFPRKNCGNLGWDAHHITKCIFEEQLIFDPYADEAFHTAALELCSYYCLRVSVKPSHKQARPAGSNNPAGRIKLSRNPANIRSRPW